jgi:hypothetical protein
MQATRVFDAFFYTCSETTAQKIDLMPKKQAVNWMLLMATPGVVLYRKTRAPPQKTKFPCLSERKGNPFLIAAESCINIAEWLRFVAFSDWLMLSIYYNTYVAFFCNAYLETWTKAAWEEATIA